MIMIIRKQIEDRIVEMMAADWGGTEKEAADDIIKIFEKLIDEKIQEIKNHYEEWDDKPYNTKYDEIFRTHYESRIKQLEELKEELTKK